MDNATLQHSIGDGGHGDGIATQSRYHIDALTTHARYLSDALTTPVRYHSNILTTPSRYLDDDADIGFLKQSIPVTVLLTLAYGLVFLLAVVNNSLVVAVIYRNPRMRTMTNYFLANLAIADITVSVLVLPITLMSNLFTEWLFGTLVCKSVAYLQAVAVSASVNTLAAVAVERYVAICKPHYKVAMVRGIWAIIAIWLIPGLLQLPWAIYCNTDYFPNGNYRTVMVCYARFPGFPYHKQFEQWFFTCVMFLTCYLVPLCLIVLCYVPVGYKVCQRYVAGMTGSQLQRNIHKSKVRAVRMLVTTTVVFALAWCPLYALRLRIFFGEMSAMERKAVIRYLVPIAQLLGSATSAVNPFIYCYFSEQFRINIKQLLPLKANKKEQHSDGNSCHNRIKRDTAEICV